MKILIIDRNDRIFQEIKAYMENSFHPFPLVYCSYDDDLDTVGRQGELPILLVRLEESENKAAELLQKVRTMSLFKNSYIMVLIPITALEKMQTYFELGADDCICLPFDLKYLHARIMVAENSINNKKAAHAAFEAYDDLKDMHAQLVQAEKMAGIGRLAAGVAHEINNPLGFVSGNIEALEKYIQRYGLIMDVLQDVESFDQQQAVEACARIADIWKEKKLKRVIEDMPELFADTKDGIQRISVIVTGLKNFSRINQQDEQGPFDLNEGVRTTLIVAKNELKYDCDVEFEAGEIPVMIVNGGQLNQVILNMLINAAHAIKERFHGQKGLIQIKTYCQDGWVCLSIKDNGCGMSEHTVCHIFEPFFTTKAVGLGTGLGLGIAYDIIYNKHMGNIEVQSVLGEGTEFIIKLPAEKQESEL